MSGIIADNSGRHTGLVKAASGGGGIWNLILTQTASSSADISFTSGLDSTYDEYVFKFFNIHPSEQEHLYFNLSTDSGSNYNVTKTSTVFQTYHGEDDGGGSISYQAGNDLAQSTGDQKIANNISIGNDSSFSGSLTLFNPSSTTFVKHFIIRAPYVEGSNGIVEYYVAGYANTTSAVDAIIFRMNSGNIDAGTISMYGIT